MASYNKVILLGNLTREVEIRYTPKGTAVGKIGLAVNRKRKGQDGQTNEETTFVDVDSFGKQAEVIAQYCGKGSALMVEGRLKLDQWEDKQSGKSRSKLGVVLESFQFVGGGTKQGGERQTPPQAAQTQNSDHLPNEDDVPF